MFRIALGSALAVVATGFVVLVAQTPSVPSATPATTLAVTARNVPQLREWDARIAVAERTGELTWRSVRSDTLLPDRTHERYDQHLNGVRVFGGDIVRQVRNGVTESIFGTLHPTIRIGTTPRLSEDDARDVYAGLTTRGFPQDRQIELVVLPLDAGGYALTWRAHVWTDAGWMQTFVDANTGAVILQYNDLQTQSFVGIGTGVLGDRKKISLRLSSGHYLADDQLRPPVLITFDFLGDHDRVDLYRQGLYRISNADIATADSSTWTDAANVDAHVHLGWTYDYYYKQFGRRGLDDRDTPIYAITHPIRRSDVPSLPLTVLYEYAVNAFWCGDCAGGPRPGAMIFGEGLPSDWTYGGQTVDYLAGALDVVAHELTHGLTQYSSALIYRNESGALNEAFSDVLGTGAEFFYHTPGGGTRNADYVIGEDVFKPGGVRSMANPQSFRDPDHYSARYLGPLDNGGIHVNSGIANQAFFLAIEGGVNRTSGLRVSGVGAANRAQIERVFFRAFTSLLTSSATFSMARAATIQAAQELYGAGSPPDHAVADAWTAVGVR